MAGLSCGCFLGHWNLMQDLHGPSCQGGWHLDVTALLTRDQSPLCKASVPRPHPRQELCSAQSCASDQPAQPNQQPGTAPMAQEALPRAWPEQPVLAPRLSLPDHKRTTLLELRAELRQNDSHCSRAGMFTMTPQGWASQR